MNIQSQKSLARLFRQLCFVPCLNNRWLNKEVKNNLTNQIAQAEKGHQGEICLIIENHLPIATAYAQNCQARAVDLFGLYKVWDTEHNTGILVYVNLCEHTLHIIADRGINSKAHDDWQALCNKTLDKFKQKHFEQGLTELIVSLGEILNRYYPSDDMMGNELPNRPIYLK